jgi:hypothetical protein
MSVQLTSHGVGRKDPTVRSTMSTKKRATEKGWGQSKEPGKVQYGCCKLLGERREMRLYRNNARARRTLYSLQRYLGIIHRIKRHDSL